MIKVHRLYRKSDLIGSLASTVCLLHCLATPLLFMAPIGHVSHSHSYPGWWRSLDFFFLTISCFAVYQSAKNSSKTAMKYALWISWAVLAGILLNEKLTLLEIPEAAIYFPTVALVALHLYNRKYCQCAGKNCCSKMYNTYPKSTN